MPTSEGHMLGTSTRGEERAPGFRIRLGPGDSCCVLSVYAHPCLPQDRALHWTLVMAGAQEMHSEFRTLGREPSKPSVPAQGRNDTCGQRFAFSQRCFLQLKNEELRLNYLYTSSTDIS